MGYSAWSRKESDTTEHTNTHMSVLDSFPHKCVVLHSLKKKKKRFKNCTYYLGLEFSASKLLL